MDWDFPVYSEPEDQLGPDRTRVQTREALPIEEALRFVAGTDPRPLLVLRECLTCNGTDDALLTRQEDNERTFLLSRWFHCIKLTPGVIEPDHPLHALFLGESPPHLFVAQPDGSGRIDLTGDRSRRELWRAMNITLARAYDKVGKQGPKKVLGEMFKMLDRLDAIDLEIDSRERRLERQGEGSGPDTPKAKKLAQEIKALRVERSQLRAKALKISTLKLLKREPKPDEGQDIGASQGV